MDLVVLLDGVHVAKKNGADLFLLEVLRKAIDLLASGAHELKELASHGIAQALDVGKAAVTDLDDRTYFTRINRGVQRIELILKCSLDICSGNLRHLLFTSGRCGREHLACMVELRLDAGVQNACRGCS